MKNISRLSYLKHKYLIGCSFYLFVLIGTIRFFNFSILEAQTTADATENMPLPIGSSNFIMRFMGHDITVEIFKPSTYVDQPLLIVMPGVVRSATNARNDAIGLACKCSCLVAAPHLSTEHFPTAADYDHGAVFPNDAYDPVTGALRQDTQPNPPDQWSLNVVLSGTPPCTHKGKQRQPQVLSFRRWCWWSIHQCVWAFFIPTLARV